MRKIVLLILLLLTFSLSYGQAIDCVGNAGDTVCQSGSFRIDERLRIKSLPNTHALGVLTTNAQGLVVLDTLDAATGVSIEILGDTSDAIHSWVWSIVSNPTIDSYLYATRGRLQKVKDSIIVWAGSTFVSTETDPVFLTYPAAGIGAGDISNWNTAYNNRVTSVATGYGVSGGTITATGTISADTAAMATRSRVQKAVDSLNISIGTKGSGTVTNVATNSGTGITGGAITGTGTIAADTFLLNTRLWREKLKDSLNILIAAKGAGTVTSVGTGYGVSGGAITSSGTIVADTATLFQKYTTTLGAGSGISISGRTISATGGTGTVTSVATNTGTGITGGTITGSGTIAADTTILGTRAWRDKLKDSLNAQDALRVKYTDTSGMLAPYLRTVNAVTATSTTTLTNKRWTARVTSQTTVSATPSINTDNQDIWKVTAQTVDITSMTTNLTGTPVDGDILEIQITGTAARAITWGSSFVSSTVTLPTTTTTTATLTVILQYYSTSSYGNNKWVCVSYW